MFCGTRSFSQIDDDPPSNSPKGSKLKQSFSMNKMKKQRSNPNPYSTTGLDKFEKVLAELDAKKEKIMLRTNSQGDATVRFTYKSDSDDWIPIIIKKREPKEEPRVSKRLSAPPSMKVEKEVFVVKKKKKGKEERKVIKKRDGWGACYWALVIVLILVLLIFGRSFAICWTTMWWYLVPMMKGGSRNLRRKEFGKRRSDKRLGGGVHELALPKGCIGGKR